MKYYLPVDVSLAKKGVLLGIFGQVPSDYPEVAEFLVKLEKELDRK